MPSLLINIYIKFFFLLTPFFLLSTFLSMTRAMDLPERKKLAVKVTSSVIIVCLILFLTGDYIFALFGITLNAFRIGTGVLLMLSAIALVQGTDKVPLKEANEDISVVRRSRLPSVRPLPGLYWSWAASCNTGGSG